MLEIPTGRMNRNCAGLARRDMIKVGSLGLGALGMGAVGMGAHAVGGLGLGQLLRTRAARADAGLATKDTSVIWLWLGGGATHVETFDPKMTAPAEYRSVTGEVATNLPGVSFGGNFERMAKIQRECASTRSSVIFASQK